MNVKKLRAVCAELYKTSTKTPALWETFFKLQFTNRPVCVKQKKTWIWLSPILTTFFMAIRVKEHLALNFGTACYII